MRDSSGVRWCRTSGKTGHCQIKASPEEMHGTAFTTKPGSELLEHPVALDKNSPKPVGVFTIVRAVFFILIECDHVLNLVRRGVDGHRQVQFSQCFHDLLVEFGNGLRTQL